MEVWSMNCQLWRMSYEVFANCCVVPELLKCEVLTVYYDEVWTVRHDEVWTVNYEAVSCDSGISKCDLCDVWTVNCDALAMKCKLLCGAWTIEVWSVNWKLWWSVNCTTWWTVTSELWSIYKLLCCLNYGSVNCAAWSVKCVMFELNFKMKTNKFH